MTQNANPPVGADGDHATFCRFCEAHCGLVATVKDGVVTNIGPDRENPHSQGHVCVKGTSAAKVTYDPDRLSQPLKRVGAIGEFVPVSWDEALEDIAQRLKAIHTRHGGEAIGTYIGNPSAFASETFPLLLQLPATLGSTKKYGAGSQDTNARQVANFIAHGQTAAFAMPDLPSCDFLLMLGANPMVSNGSLMFVPRIRHDLDAIAARGRVVVVDPRHSETAHRYEHLPIRPNGDVWLLMGMLRVLIDESLVDPAMIERDVVGWDELSRRILRYTLEECAGKCQVEAERIAQLSRDFVQAKRASVYGRVGICRGRYATLTNLLVTALNAVTGSYNTEGGTMFGRQVLPARKLAVSGYGDAHSRIGGVPSVGGHLPSALMPDDILMDGPDRMRALIVAYGNPVLSAPGGARLEEALETLELMVSCDLYMTETNRHAHYILPGLTFLERADFPLFGMMFLVRPFLQYTDAVIKPIGQARNEHDVFQEIFRRMGWGAASPSKKTRWLGRLGLKPNPLGLIDLGIRLGPVGDRFGLRKGWSLKRLRQNPHGVIVDAPHTQPTWRSRIAHPDRKIHVWHTMLEPEFARLARDDEQDAPFRLVGMREIRSLNSWMHNIDRLVRSQKPTLLMHPDDAAMLEIDDGETVRLSTRMGELKLPISLTDKVVRGAVCYPHGWGHAGGWQRANATPALNINSLLGVGLEGVELLSGTSLIDGLPVSIEKLGELIPVRASA